MGNGIRTHIFTLRGWPPQPISMIPTWRRRRIYYIVLYITTLRPYAAVPHLKRFKVFVLVMGFEPTLCLRWYCKRASLLRFHSIFRCFCKLYSWFYTFKISTTDFVYLRSVQVLSYTSIYDILNIFKIVTMVGFKPTTTFVDQIRILGRSFSYALHGQMWKRATLHHQGN